MNKNKHTKKLYKGSKTEFAGAYKQNNKRKIAKKERNKTKKKCIS